MIKMRVSYTAMSSGRTITKDMTIRPRSLALFVEHEDEHGQRFVLLNQFGTDEWRRLTRARTDAQDDVMDGDGGELVVLHVGNIPPHLASARLLAQLLSPIAFPRGQATLSEDAVKVTRKDKDTGPWPAPCPFFAYKVIRTLCMIL